MIGRQFGQVLAKSLSTRPIPVGFSAAVHSINNASSPPLPNSLKISKANMRHGRQLSAKQPRLLIFDKDGTLICFNSLWVPWVYNFAAQLDRATRLSVSSKVFRALGFCPIQKKVRHGLLAAGTMGQIQEKVVQILVQHGLDSGKAGEIVHEATHRCSTTTTTTHHSNSTSPSSSRPLTVRQLCNLEALFQQLKGRGIKIAICTADSRASTLGTLETLGVKGMVDLVVCGDDRGSKPKPDPGNALFICRQLGVDPGEAMMVGDTPADLGMGRRARLGTTVGVLSGVGEPGELAPEADHLVEDVGELVRLIG